jgi:putative transposase
MARIARVVAPGVPHHVTQRGNRRQPVFFSEADYRLYIGLMAEWCRKSRVEVWAYCLMTNHVHLIAVPCTGAGLARAVGEAHRRYTRLVNEREGWIGYLWQGRFSSCPLDEPHLLTAARYIEQNPFQAKLVQAPWKYRWSSAAVHVKRQDDGLVKAAPLLEMVNEDWRSFLGQEVGAFERELLLRHIGSGRPLGSESFVERLESTLHRRLRPRRRGRPRKAADKQ